MTRDYTWHKSILGNNATLEDAARNLDEHGMQIVLVVGEDGRLAGTLSDGDIRRGLLRGMRLDMSVAGIVNTTPMVVPPSVPKETVLQLMKANRIRQVPVVDANNEVVGLHFWDTVSMPIELPNVMIIMAGGLGSRLRPYTEDCPKPMLHVAGKPMLEHIMGRAMLEGFRKFVISLGYLGHVIEDHFGDGKRLGAEISYLKEEKPLGTAGALSLVNAQITDPIVISNGDVISDIRYGELLRFHERHGADGTMAIRSHEWQNPYGVVKTNGVDIVGFEEKPTVTSHINAGVYVLGEEVLGTLRRDSYLDMPSLFERLKASGKRTIAYPIHESWMDVGKPQDLKAANETTTVTHSAVLKEAS